MVEVVRPQRRVVVQRGQRLPVLRTVREPRIQIATSRQIITGSNTEFEFTQVSPLSTWTVNHNLGRRPTAVAVLSPGGVEVEAGVIHVSNSQLVVQFSQPYSGSVRVS